MATLVEKKTYKSYACLVFPLS